MIENILHAWFHDYCHFSSNKDINRTQPLYQKQKNKKKNSASGTLFDDKRL